VQNAIERRSLPERLRELWKSRTATSRGKTWRPTVAAIARDLGVGQRYPLVPFASPMSFSCCPSIAGAAPGSEAPVAQAIREQAAWFVNEPVTPRGGRFSSGIRDDRRPSRRGMVSLPLVAHLPQEGVVDGHDE
jgi:hypothetical protein